ncbi:transcription antitermination factor NusB [bacterium]|nr:transcription antitermination factor NusB [bacterium]
MIISFTEGRRIARESALKILYAHDLANGDINVRISNYYSYFSNDNDTGVIKEYTLILVLGVNEHKEDIDKIIVEYSENWEIDRMLTVDRNILRFAIFELLYIEEIPPIVSINEAIEIGKKYGNVESKRFINGILDNVQKDIKKDKK